MQPCYTGRASPASVKFRRRRAAVDTPTLIGTATPGTVTGVDDKVLCYGYAEELEALSARQAGCEGDEEHTRAFSRHAARQHVERVQDDTKPPEKAG